MRRVLIVAGALLVAVVFGSPLKTLAEDAPAGGCGKGSACDKCPKTDKGETLKKFDKDADGKLSDAEKADMKAAWEAKRAERHKEILAKYDKDGDGTLSDEEKKAMHEARKAEMQKKFDKDGDGKLSDEEKAEMDKAMKHHKGKGGRRCGKAPEAPAPAPAE